MGSLEIAGVSSGKRVNQWVAAHEELTLLARRRAELDGLEGPALLRALRARVHRHLGLGSFAEYIERLFGYSRRTLDDKLRTAEALENLPELTRSLRDGVVSWSAVRELARVATPETEREWLDAARGRPVHEVERLVSGRRRGARPIDEPDATGQRHTLRFEVSAETFSTFREAMTALRQKSNGPLDDDSALLLLAREVLGGPADEGKSSYQVALNICERCGRGSHDSRGEAVPVDASIVEMARCDAQNIGRVASPQRVACAATRETLSGDEPTHVGDEMRDIHVGANDLANETHVGDEVRDAHVGANDLANETHVGESARATQSIPPALRRKIIRRDHGCCVVPGCRHSTFVDLHHIQTRADGGAHDENNLIVLCSAHHRAVHRGQLQITGRVGHGLAVRRGDGSHYGALDAPRSADACERAFRALRNLGFRESDARRAVQRAQSQGNTEAVLRQALSLLTDHGWQCASRVDVEPAPRRMQTTPSS